MIVKSVQDLIVGLVGPCGSGKSTLSKRLADRGIRARHIAQEHSYVATMWKRISNPDLLIFLDASYAETIRRRKLNWTVEEYQEQQRRLIDARKNADLYIFTDPLSIDDVENNVLKFLRDRIDSTI